MAIWNKSHRGAWHLYGHSHANAEEGLNKLMPERKSFDVGVDNAAVLLGSYRPFTFEEVKKIMDKKKGCSIDHHKGSGNE
jgi:calcineurin-like phosphoesterase family protein